VPRLGQGRVGVTLTTNRDRERIGENSCWAEQQ